MVVINEGSSSNVFMVFKYKRISAPSLPDSCMPMGMKAEDTHTKLVPVTPSK